MIRFGPVPIMRRSSIVVERYVETPRCWILTRGPVNNGGSVGMTSRGRQIISGEHGYDLAEEESLNVLAIYPVWEGQADESEVGVMAVVIPGEPYAWIQDMDAERKGKKTREPIKVSSKQVEMWSDR